MGIIGYAFSNDTHLSRSTVNPSQTASKSRNPQSAIHNPPLEEAEACFRKAIEIARQQSAKSWELRAVTSLSRLWQRQGRQKQAHKMLADIYSWFTEGFDTGDLRKARALLEEIAK